MRIKSVFFILLGMTLVACSPSNEVTNSQPVQDNVSSENYSAKKQSYIKSCVDTSTESFCSCQFDVMDPMLSNSIGQDWNTRNMEEKNFEKYVTAVESAVSQCN
jgi:hypothetical protein